MKNLVRFEELAEIYGRALQHRPVYKDKIRMKEVKKEVGMNVIKMMM